MKVLKIGLKVLIGLLVLLVLLALIGYFALTRWINPNDFKPQIISAVNQATGRNLTLSGDLSWTLYPNLGIHIGSAALSNPAGFSQPTFASMDSADLLLNWNALLHGKIQINNLVVNDLQVFLITDGSKNNWSFPFQNPGTAHSQSANNGMSFSLNKFSLNNATINYDDYQAKAHYALNNLNMMIPDFSLAAPMTVKAVGNLNTDDIAAAFKLNTRFAYDQTRNVVTLNNLALSTSSTYTNDNNQVYQFNLQSSGNVILDLKQQIVNLEGINFNLNQTVGGQLNMTVKNFSQLHYSGTVNIPSFALGDLLGTFNQALPNIPNKDQFNNTRFQTDFTGDLNSVTLKNLLLGFGNTNISGNLRLASFSPFKMKEDLQIDQADLADFTNLNGARLPLQGLSLNGELSADSFDTEDFPSSLNAAQTLTIQDITLKGFDLASLLNNLDVMINNIVNLKKESNAYQSIQDQINQLQDAEKTTMNAGNGKQTDFGSLSTKIFIHNGVITTPNLLISGKLVQIKAHGKVDLNQKAIDYQLNSQVLASNRDIIKNLVIPYNISGPFSHIRQGIDWSSVQAQIMKFIAGQLGQTVTSFVSTVVSAPVTAAGGAAKEITGALSHLFHNKASAS